jgi:cell division protease FtsH
MAIAQKKNATTPALSSRTLSNILDSAQALAKGRSRLSVTPEELFLAVACNKKFSRIFPLDIVEKVSLVVESHVNSVVPLDQDVSRLLAAVDQIEKVPGKQVELLVKWIRNSAMKNSEQEVMELFRKEEIHGVRLFSFQSRILRQLHSIEMELHSSVKGQEKAIDQVLKQLAGWMLTPEKELKKPFKLAFCGPASCGKRLLATSLAKVLKLENGNPIPFMELDLKGYCSHQNWEGLTGHSSSYSSGKEGVLTGFVKNNPKCIILLSHLESAHENTIGALAAVLLNGEAVDRYKDTPVDFSRCMIIATTSRELGVESGIDSSVTAELAKSAVCFEELAHSTLYGICRDAFHESRVLSEKRLNISLDGITNSLAYYLAARQMPDANVRNIADSAKNLIWEKALDAYMLAVESGIDELSSIVICSPMLAELESSPEPQALAGHWLKRLAASRRRLDFRTEIRLEGGRAVIELLDIREEMVAAPSDRGLILEGIPESGLDSVIGHADAINRLRTVAGLLGDVQSDTSAAPRGILLHGAPGTGKTACARGFAAEAGIPMIRVSASDLLSPLSGGTAHNVRHAFSVCARYATPTHAVLFIDEIDTLAKEREAITELLTCMQGVHDFDSVLVIGTTNRPDDLDKALLRRFDMKIAFDLPGPVEREEILAWYMKDQKAAADIRLGVIARMAVGLSGAFIQDMVSDARRLALQRGDGIMAEADLQTSLEHILFGESSRKCICSDEERRIVAFHEAGHAVLLLHLSPETAKDLAGISILTRNGIGGAMLREDTSNIMHIQKVVEMIAVLFGGMEAERICLGVESTGCASDLQKAASAAEKLVLCFGYRMDGQVTGNGEGYYPYVDEGTRARAAEQVRLLLKEQRERGATLISEHKKAIERVATVLMAEERLAAAHISMLVDDKEAA